MSSNGQDPHWGTPEDGVQRGPSFEDPIQPPPEPSPPTPEQSWDQAWGLSDDAQPGTDTAWPAQPGGTADWGGAPGQGAPPLHTTAPGPTHQGTPQGAAQGPTNPYGAPQGPWGADQNPYASQPYPSQDPYGQPVAHQLYGPYGAYNPYAYAPPGKSKTTAALLAFFLGQFGAHSFYLNKKNLGFIHLGIAVGGFVLPFLAGIITVAASTPTSSSDTLLGLVVSLSGILFTGNIIWAFVEFIMILIKPEHELGR